MRKDGIQTRKRKPKSQGKSGVKDDIKPEGKKTFLNKKTAHSTTEILFMYSLFLFLACDFNN